PVHPRPAVARAAIGAGPPGRPLGQPAARPPGPPSRRAARARPRRRRILVLSPGSGPPRSGPRRPRPGGRVPVCRRVLVGPGMIKRPRSLVSCLVEAIYYSLVYHILHT